MKCRRRSWQRSKKIRKRIQSEADIAEIETLMSDIRGLGRLPKETASKGVEKDLAVKFRKVRKLKKLDEAQQAELLQLRVQKCSSAD